MIPDWTELNPDRVAYTEDIYRFCAYAHEHNQFAAPREGLEILAPDNDYVGVPFFVIEDDSDGSERKGPNPMRSDAWLGVVWLVQFEENRPEEHVIVPCRASAFFSLTESYIPDPWRATMLDFGNAYSARAVELGLMPQSAVNPMPSLYPHTPSPGQSPDPDANP